MHLVTFIIRIYHDAWSAKCRIQYLYKLRKGQLVFLSSAVTKLLNWPFKQAILQLLKGWLFAVLEQWNIYGNNKPRGMCRHTLSLVKNQACTPKVPQSLAKLPRWILNATASADEAEVQRISEVPYHLDIFRKTHTASIDHVTFEVFDTSLQSFHCSNCSIALTLILRRSRTGTVWFYTSTSNKRAARPKLYTKLLTRDLKRMYSRLTLVRISINL